MSIDNTDIDQVLNPQKIAATTYILWKPNFLETYGPLILAADMSSRRELGVCSRWEYEDEKALVLICKTYFHPDDQDKQVCKGFSLCPKTSYIWQV